MTQKEIYRTAQESIKAEYSANYYLLALHKIDNVCTECYYYSTLKKCDIKDNRGDKLVWSVKNN